MFLSRCICKTMYSKHTTIQKQNLQVQYTVGLLYGTITCTVKRLCVQYTILQSVNKMYHHIFRPQDFHPVWISFKWHFIQFYHHLMFFKDTGYCWQRETCWTLLKIWWSLTIWAWISLSLIALLVKMRFMISLSLAPLWIWGRSLLGVLDIQSYVGQTKYM